jgi:Zn-dependent protease/predicted transcriptional regulator
MRWSYNIGSVSGIRINLHITFLALLAWVILVNSAAGQTINEIFISVGFIIAIFLCVTIHELSHALVAKRFNYKTKDINLFPIGGIANIEQIPEKPKEELLITIVGPITNFVIAGILYLILASTGGLTSVELTFFTPRNFLMNLMMINLIIGLFNLLPAFPMDGGRILRALLSFWKDRITATRWAASIGQILAGIFFITGLFYNPFLALIGVFVFFGARIEAQQTEVIQFLEGYKVQDVMMHHYVVFQASNFLDKVVQMFLDGQENQFLVMDLERVVGVLTSKEILKGLAEKGENVIISDIMKKDYITLEPEMPLKQAYNQMLNKDISIFPVMTGGKLEGVLNIENIIEFIMVKNAINNYHQYIQPIQQVK